MNKSPAFQWYPKDVLTSARVAEMTLEEEGAYRRAIDYCWIQGSLPNDEERLARIIGKGCSTTVARVVGAMFKQDANDPTRLVHERLDLEREKQARWAEKSAEGGRKSAEKRKAAKINEKTSRVVEPPHIPKANSSSSSSSSSSFIKDISNETSFIKKTRLREQGGSVKIKRLFDFWQRRMESQRSVFSEKRKRLATNILKIYSYRDCLRAIVGCLRSDWHMGRHPDNQTLYNEFDRIFKNPETTEKFIGYFFKSVYKNNQPNNQLTKEKKTTGDIYAERINNTNNIIHALLSAGERKRNLSSTSYDNSEENNITQQLSAIN